MCKNNGAISELLLLFHRYICEAPPPLQAELPGNELSFFILCPFSVPSQTGVAGHLPLKMRENKKADLKSAFGVCPLFGTITVFPSSEARFSQRAYALEGFPFLCFLLFGLSPFWDSCGFPNPFGLYNLIA